MLKPRLNFDVGAASVVAQMVAREIEKCEVADNGIHTMLVPMLAQMPPARIN